MKGAACIRHGRIKVFMWCDAIILWTDVAGGNSKAIGSQWSREGDTMTLFGQTRFQWMASFVENGRPVQASRTKADFWLRGESYMPLPKNCKIRTWSLTYKTDTNSASDGQFLLLYFQHQEVTWKKLDKTWVSQIDKLEKQDPNLTIDVFGWEKEKGDRAQ